MLPDQTRYAVTALLHTAEGTRLMPTSTRSMKTSRTETRINSLAHRSMVASSLTTESIPPGTLAATNPTTAIQAGTHQTAPGSETMVFLPTGIRGIPGGIIGSPISRTAMSATQIKKICVISHLTSARWTTMTAVLTVRMTGISTGTTHLNEIPTEIDSGKCPHTARDSFRMGVVPMTPTDRCPMEVSIMPDSILTWYRIRPRVLPLCSTNG